MSKSLKELQAGDILYICGANAVITKNSVREVISDGMSITICAEPKRKKDSFTYQIRYEQCEDIDDGVISYAAYKEGLHYSPLYTDWRLAVLEAISIYKHKLDHEKDNYSNITEDLIAQLEDINIALETYNNWQLLPLAQMLDRWHSRFDNYYKSGELLYKSISVFDDISALNDLTFNADNE